MARADDRRANRWALAVALLLLLWATRLPALDAFPLHVDEGIYLNRALQVWNLHPFWEITDGRFINHWPIALFYPQNAPVFIARVSTPLFAVLGASAGFALLRRMFGLKAAVLGVVLWIASPFAFFFERTALCDSQPGALVVATLWAGVGLAQRGRVRDALLTGLTMTAAILYKFTAAPFLAMVVLVVMLVGGVPWRRRLTNLAIVGALLAAGFAAPLAYMALRGRSLAYLFGWVGVRSGGPTLLDQFASNVARFCDLLWTFGTPQWAALMLVGLALLATRRIGLKLVLASAIPFLLMLLFTRELFSRHYLVMLPPALTLAGAGLGVAIRAFVRSSRAGWVLTGTLAFLLGTALAPFAVAAYRNPGNLPLPPPVWDEYVATHSAGFGLREAVEDFPKTIVPRDAPIVASMFPHSCQRANFYDEHGFGMRCGDAPGLVLIDAALVEHDVVYVLVEAPPVGLDVRALATPATRVAAYPRPGETEETASVVLWRLERPEGGRTAGDRDHP